MDAQIFAKESYLRTAFQMFDVDGSGKIDNNEIMQLIGGEEFKELYTTEQIMAAIGEIDENGDGEIDFEEFMHMMKSLDN